MPSLRCLEDGGQKAYIVEAYQLTSDRHAEPTTYLFVLSACTHCMAVGAAGRQEDMNVVGCTLRRMEWGRGLAEPQIWSLRCQGHIVALFCRDDVGLNSSLWLDTPSKSPCCLHGGLALLRIEVGAENVSAEAHHRSASETDGATNMSVPTRHKGTQEISVGVILSAVMKHITAMRLFQAIDISRGTPSCPIRSSLYQSVHDA